MIDVEKYDWSKLKDNKTECVAIRKDISTARGVINEGMLRYVKKKIGARNKAQAADMELMFKDLEMYESESEIQDAYGWEFISEKECDRLIALWRKRKQYVADSGKFSDRVTQMLQHAMDGIGEEFIDFLNETASAEQTAEKQRKEIEKENARIDHERYIASLKSDNG